jgi:Flp pilus assembly protein TadG
MPTWNRLHTAATNVSSRLRQEHGQALVEFAVSLPVLMLIILGILYFGRYESYSNQMTQLSEVGARDAAVNMTVPTPYASLAAYIAGQATGELAAGSQDVGALSVRVDCLAGSSCTSGTNVVVCLQSAVQFPFLQIKTGTIYQQATMRVETAGAVDSTYGTNVPSC